MTSDDGLPLSQRQRLFDLITAARDASSPSITAPADYADLDLDVIKYVESFPRLRLRVEATRLVILDRGSEVLVIERAAQVKEAA
jgi:hypothetical protein